MSEQNQKLPEFWGVGVKPFSAPSAPDRSLERIYAFVGLLMVAGIAAMVIYIDLRIGFGDIKLAALLAMMLIFPAAFGWSAWSARKKRLQAEAEVTKFHELIRSIQERESS
ncbi:hypothetical protein FJQ54_11960 [Sandaracinobacter neustonicus]|uniref:Uncharacterized protein n=1 Tax=Sandaracinobacter neustonicus TaxID=1715348 RepID=A0A501XHV5_9SPHN|nr:hypothetical protein [Sandaracinobacter neustonicus]TPE60120.1 hypothetical protein FJQ54_11960 [Sandaracinobacter neustonicus]